MKYRYLKAGEIIKNGDETRFSPYKIPAHNNKYSWIPCSLSIGRIVPEVSIYLYRRKLHVRTKPKYRFLKMGEVVIPGDEQLCNDTQWHKINYKLFEGYSIASYDLRMFRRKV